MADPCEPRPTWKPATWRNYEALQMAMYDDQEAYGKVMSKLSKVPPLVTPGEVDSLIDLLAAAGRGKRFIIQDGDCAERFMDCQGERLDSQLKLVVQMGAIVEAAAGIPTVRIARIAGQYGKVRTAHAAHSNGRLAFARCRCACGCATSTAHSVLPTRACAATLESDGEACDAWRDHVVQGRQHQRLRSVGA